MKKKFKNKSTCVPPHACQKGVLCCVHDVDEDEFDYDCEQEGFNNKKKKSVRREVDVELLDLEEKTREHRIN